MSDIHDLIDSVPPRTDGGPAFPLAVTDGVFIQEGMSLRDYFAVHADQPGMTEIVAAAGLRLLKGQIWADDEGPIFPSFNAWWESLDQNARFELSAQVRYAMAEAMLEARSK